MASKNWSKELEAYLERAAKKQHISDKQILGTALKNQDQEFLARRVDAIKNVRSQNPDWRPNISKGRLEWLKTPEAQQQRKELGIKQRTDKAFKQACIEGNKTRWLKDQNNSVCPHCKAHVDNANYNKHHGDLCVFKGKKIVCYDGNTKVAEYYSREDVVNDGLIYEQVRNCINGKRESYKRYTFKLVKR